MYIEDDNPASIVHTACTSTCASTWTSTYVRAPPFTSSLSVLALAKAFPQETHSDAIMGYLCKPIEKKIIFPILIVLLFILVS